MKKIKNIFFDFGRTVVQHPEDGAGLRIVQHFGSDLSEADAQMLRGEIFSVAKYSNRLDEGSLSRDEYRQLLCDSLPERLHEVALAAADYPIDMLPFIPGMDKLLMKLRELGYKLYITSNLDSLHAEQMWHTVYRNYFDDMIFSSEIKVRKPYPEFFKRACEKFKAAPEETLFIDDLEENVAGALLCGIKGFVFGGNPDEALDFILAAD